MLSYIIRILTAEPLEEIMTEADYKSILDSLTLEEKASLCSGMTNWLRKEMV